MLPGVTYKPFQCPQLMAMNLRIALTLPGSIAVPPSKSMEAWIAEVLSIHRSIGNHWVWCSEHITVAHNAKYSGQSGPRA